MALTQEKSVEFSSGILYCRPKSRDYVRAALRCGKELTKEDIKMRGSLNFLAAVTVAFSLALVGGGCAKKVVRTDDAAAAERDRAAAEAAERAQREAARKSLAEESLTSRPTSSETAVLEGRTSAPMLPVYFEFDQFDVRDDQQSRIEGNATFLRSESGARVRVEGNCDERGTNEYNMALGERRALSGKNYLVNLGIDANRIETLSYGEERPLLHGHDELSWAQNRRDDFVLVK